MVRRFMQDIRDRLQYEIERFMATENLRGRDQVAVRVPVDQYRLNELGVPVPEFVRMCRALGWHVEHNYDDRALFVVHRIPIRAVPRYRMPPGVLPLRLEPGAIMPLPAPEIEYHFEMDLAATARDYNTLYADGNWPGLREPMQEPKQAHMSNGYTERRENGEMVREECFEIETIEVVKSWDDIFGFLDHNDFKAVGG